MAPSGSYASGSASIRRPCPVVGELDAAAHQLIERATALKSLLCFRILVLLASALTYCSWLTTYSVVSTANTDTTRIIEGNVTINAGAQSVGSLWLVAGVQFCGC